MNKKRMIHLDYNLQMEVPTLFLLLSFAEITAAAFKICAFNIKSFGEAKASNKKVMSSLVKILSRCDISVIQEVRDSKGEAIPALVKELNRADVVEVIDSYQYVEDHPDHPEVFAREPFTVRFHSPKTAIKDFVLISHHTCPRDAAREINKLLLVMLEVKSRWKIENVMLLGDLNASCGYVTVDEWKEIQRRSANRFHWLIGDKDDTTVSQKTHCAYDRIVVHGEEFFKAIVPATAKPYNFKKKLGLSEEEALEVSDHFPVEVNLRTDPRMDREL
ncbi:deoxyribonuclease gamma-like isoform X2 [Pelobates fuscus]|uniref:deoxyribonuclease gamma-like isoform X2 n=1 Tax=Pelobates fuscus TaxID=191477 RepID=UPI002FE43EF0